MPVKRWGAGQIEPANIPTLSDWLEENSNQNAKSFQVAKVSKSQQYNSYTLHCLAEPTAGFRVNVYPETHLYNVISDNFKDWRVSGTPVYVMLVDDEWGHWEIGTGDEQTCSWKQKGHGFIATKAVEAVETSE